MEEGIAGFFEVVFVYSVAVFEVVNSVNATHGISIYEVSRAEELLGVYDFEDGFFQKK